MISRTFKNKIKYLLALVIILTSLFVYRGLIELTSAAACSIPSGSGSATATINIPATGNYRIWNRMKADSSDATNNSFYLEIDGNTCLLVGNNSEISNANWFWVDYTNGAPASSKADHNFATTGSHTIKIIEHESRVSLDRIILTQDTSCVPTGTGDNCADPPDTTPPSVSVTSPSDGSTVSGQFNITAVAADDDSGVQKVEFLIDGSKVGEDTSSPYAFDWNSASVLNGGHTASARAIDNSGNIAVSPLINFNVSNTSSGGVPDGYQVGYRVNSGGSSISGTPNWSADTSTNPSEYVSNVSGQTASTTQAITLDSSVPNGTPMEMFQTERYDNDTGSTVTPMTYSFPATSGKSYKARLYFSERNSTFFSVGARVMDVRIEGNLVLDNYDTYAEVGGYTGQMKEFDITPDNSLDISFHHVSGTAPRVMGIEILESTQSSSTLDEDINEDGKVDLLDFSLLASKFGQSGNSLGRVDINSDGKVDLLDFSLLASKFGQSST